MKRVECVIFDLDGVIADCSHRLHFLDQVPKDWDSFYSNCHHDEPFHYAVRLTQILNNTGVKVFICTGRPQSWYLKTVGWLLKYDVRWSMIFMRKDGDFRRDDIIKTEMLANIRSSGFEPLFAIEDRPRLVKMYREQGIPCLQSDDREWVSRREE